MKIWTSSHTFDHKWEDIAFAQNHKYPNEFTPSVHGVDVIDRKIEHGVLKSHRLIQSEWPAIPWFFAAIIGLDRKCCVHEYSEIDARNKTYKMRSVNLNFKNFVNIEESMTYTPHPLDTSKTVLHQEAVIKAQGLPLIDYVESGFANGFNTNSKLGRQAVDSIARKFACGASDLASAIDISPTLGKISS